MCFLEGSDLLRHGFEHVSYNVCQFLKVWEQTAKSPLKMSQWIPEYNIRCLNRKNEMGPLIENF